MESSAVLERAVELAGIASGSRIVAAVSGGPDSVALLDTLERLAGRYNWVLLVAHVNHGLRGEEADGDEQFVRDLASGRGLEMEVARLCFSPCERVSEATARTARYAALERMQTRWGGDLIATGHTADDQAETFIMRLLRGSGVRGLAAMSTRRDTIVRPFLGIQREVILTALQERGLVYRLDSTNRTPRPLRNRVRSQVLPVLALLQPRTVEMIGRAAANLAVTADFLRGEADRVLDDIVIERSAESIEGSVSLWRALHPVLQYGVLERLLESLHGVPCELDAATFARASAALAGDPHVRHQMTLPGTVLQTSGGRFTLRTQSLAADEQWEPTILAVPSVVRFPGGEVSAEGLSADAAALSRIVTVSSANHALCKAQRVTPPLIVRCRQPGDRLRPLGAGGSRKVQDVLVDHHVPAARRGLVPIVSDARGVVWVAGHVLDERYALTAADREVIHLVFRPPPGHDRDTMRG